VWEEDSASCQPLDARGHQVPRSPFVEQQTIADFLDERIASIDALIAKKERLIELLQESGRRSSRRR